jgi:hypothetical protein
MSTAATQREEAEYCTAVARQAEILARPDLVALIERARTLTGQERAALHTAHLPHYRTHRRTMSDLWHRFVHTVGAPHWRDTFSALEDIGRVAKAGRDWHADRDWSAADTVRDVAKAFIMGDLLSDSERLVFTSPWLAVFGELPAPAPADSVPARRAASRAVIERASANVEQTRADLADAYAGVDASAIEQAIAARDAATAALAEVLRKHPSADVVAAVLDTQPTPFVSGWTTLAAGA